jgi:hypothetical protein
MRCYICDYSPTCDSLYREGLQNTNYTQLWDSTFTAPSEYNTLIDLPDGRSICDQCNRMSRDQDNRSFDLQYGAGTPQEAEADLILEAANDNEPIDVEFEDENDSPIKEVA